MMRAPATAQNAEILALQALGWLVGDEDGMARFLSLSGSDPASLCQAAGSCDMARAILDFLLSDETLLLRFCESASIDPRAVPMARSQLD
jgi:hypothetical protein